MKNAPYEMLVILGFGSALLFHFGCIVKYGTFYIHEPYPIILWGEIIFIIVLMVASVIRAIKRKGGIYEIPPAKS